MSITLQLGLETEQKLRKFSTQKGLDLEQFVAELIKEHLDTRLTEEEELLEKIQQGIAIEKWQKYHELKEKRIAETLTTEEYQELNSIYNAIEEANAERMLYLVQLSKLRNIPVRQLMEDLGIKQPKNV
jgi:nucleotidyltransferase/DNA polymerase involved in DNA repair